MGDDMLTSAAGFQDPSNVAPGKHGRNGAEKDTDEDVGDTLLESGY